LRASARRIRGKRTEESVTVIDIDIMEGPRMPTIRRASLLLFASMALLLSSFAQADLPDFTGLVEKNTPTVVSITATKTGASSGDDPSEVDPEEVPDIFRYFFGDPRNPGGPGQRGPNVPGNPHRGLRPDRVSAGSGFIVSADGYVLTNHHVVDGADTVRVRLKDRRDLIAKVIGSDAQSDIALLKLDASNLPVAALGSSDALKPGQWVVAIGSPFNFDYTVTAGIVSAKGRAFSQQQRYVPFIQTDVAINSGNSGGPLFNLQGEVVGINSQIFSNTGGYMGVSFAIPIEVAKSVMAQLKTKGKVSRGSLGVVIQEITRDHADAIGLPTVGGALVAQISAGSAAEKAGVKVQDVITAYNGIEVERSSDLPPLVGNTAPGTRGTLSIVRDGKAIELPVVVGELDDGGAAVAAATPSESKPRDSLGLSVRDLSANEREETGLDKDGVVVADVTGTAALRAGVRAGDIVLMVGRTRVGSAAEFAAAAKSVEKGSAVMLLIRRGDQQTFIPVRPPAGD
jgi:serine protease Do